MATATINGVVVTGTAEEIAEIINQTRTAVTADNSLALQEAASRNYDRLRIQKSLNENRDQLKR